MLLYCSECQRDSTFLINSDGYRCCDNCGLVDSHYVHLLDSPDYHKQLPKHVDYKDWEEETLSTGDIWTSVTTNLSSSKNRYKPIFHWNERIAQLCCVDPKLPSKPLQRIWFEVFDGAHGPRENFTRANVITILKKLHLRHFRERWKSILLELNPNFVNHFPTADFLERVEHIYNAVETRFYEMKGEMMPKSVIRKSNGIVRLQDRHSNLPFNYLFRKICESQGVITWHNELPLLRSASKLHNLDDITRVIFKHVGIKFKRTIVLRRPKLRKLRPKSKKRQLDNNKIK